MSGVITGRLLTDGKFRVHETVGIIDAEAAMAVVNGELAAYHIRRFMSAKTCDCIVRNFWSSPARVPRPDGVDGFFIGAYHYAKTTKAYLEQAATSRPGVESLYTGTINPAEELRTCVGKGAVARHIRMRPAGAYGMSAGEMRALCWTNAGAFLLEPHDDLAQLRAPMQRDFEIQKVRTVVAANLYPEVPPGEGQLKIWNIQPDEKARERLRLDYTGFPYPPELLEGYESLTINVETGDACLANGGQIHAVLQGTSRRLLLTFFMGLIGNELVWWT
jgi:hypothetical protein